MYAGAVVVPCFSAVVQQPPDDQRLNVHNVDQDADALSEDDQPEQVLSKESQFTKTICSFSHTFRE